MYNVCCFFLWRFFGPETWLAYRAKLLGQEGLRVEVIETSGLTKLIPFRSAITTAYGRKFPLFTWSFGYDPFCWSWATSTEGPGILADVCPSALLDSLRDQCQSIHIIKFCNVCAFVNVVRA